MNRPYFSEEEGCRLLNSRSVASIGVAGDILITDITTEAVTVGGSVDIVTIARVTADGA